MKQLTTHVLDTANGIPGAGISIDLYHIGKQRRWVKTLMTNADGRTDEPMLSDSEFQQGEWELVFHVGAYFAGATDPNSKPLFLDTVPLRFGIHSDAHYHVPLLVSPWSYSTYRGS